MTEHRESESVELEGFGVRISAVSKELAIVVLILAVVSLVSVAGWVHHTETIASSQRLEQEIGEMVYILSLPQEKRENLNLAMPSSLREKTRRYKRDEDGK